MNIKLREIGPYIQTRHHFMWRKGRELYLKRVGVGRDCNNKGTQEHSQHRGQNISHKTIWKSLLWKSTETGLPGLKNTATHSRRVSFQC